jgi:hypothetical protein
MSLIERKGLTAPIVGPIGGNWTQSCPGLMAGPGSLSSPLAYRVMVG